MHSAMCASLGRCLLFALKIQSNRSLPVLKDRAVFDIIIPYNSKSTINNTYSTETVTKC